MNKKFREEFYKDDSPFIMCKSKEEWKVVYKELQYIYGDWAKSLGKTNGYPLFISIGDDTWADEDDMHKDCEKIEGEDFYTFADALKKEEPVISNVTLWALS